ncbi:MAG: Ig-like domain-containing protein, partial [Planctomycetota bacterium]
MSRVKSVCRSSPRRWRKHALPIAAGLVLAACSSGGGSSTETDSPIPVAIQPAAQQTQMIEDTGSTLLIRAEDARFAERELTVTITGPPRKGLLNVLAGRSPLEVTFTPDEDFAGTDSFTFVVRNPDGAESAPT